MILSALLALSLHLAPAQDTTAKQPLVAAFSAGAFQVGPVGWGSSPWFVLYQDGTVIRRRLTANDSVTFEMVELSPSETTALLDSLRLTPEFFRLSDQYNNVPKASDLPMYTLWAWEGKSAKEVTLTGVLDSTTVFARIDTAVYRAQSPRVFVSAIERLYAYRHPDAKPWSPSGFEIVLTDSPYAAESVPWPSGWPTWTASGAYCDRRGDCHIPLDSSQVREFLKRYGSEARRTGFKANGKVWVGVLRPLLPGDRLWNP